MNRAVALTLLALGCSATTIPNAPADVPSAPDTPVTPDAQLLNDALSPDSAVDPDTSIPPDASVPPDASTLDAFIDDATPPPDVALGPSLEGRWRAVGWTYTPPGAAEPIHITDHDTPVVIDPSTGRSAPFRINGILRIQPTRASYAVGILSTSHFYVPFDATTPDAYSASGFTIPGLYDRATQRFTYPGAMMSLQLHVTDDAHITLGDSSTNIVAFERVTAATPVLTFVNTLVAAQLRHPTTSAPFAHPRAAILWDVPSSTAPRPETHGFALTFAMGYAGFPLALASPPDAALVQTVERVRAAVGHPIVYDDLNEDGAYTAADTLRGVSPIALAWVDPTTPTVASTRFADLQPGYQYVHVHTDYTRGADGFAPFDPTLTVNPDVPVDDARVTTAVPNVLR